MLSLPIGLDTFLIHPSLNYYIRQQRDKIYTQRYHIIQFIKIGHNIIWSENDDLILEYYLLANKVDNEQVKLNLLSIFDKSNKHSKSEVKTKFYNIFSPYRERAQDFVTIKTLGDMLINLFF